MITQSLNNDQIQTYQEKEKKKNFQNDAASNLKFGHGHYTRFE